MQNDGKPPQNATLNENTGAAHLVPTTSTRDRKQAKKIPKCHGLGERNLSCLAPYNNGSNKTASESGRKTRRHRLDRFKNCHTAVPSTGERSPHEPYQTSTTPSPMRRELYSCNLATQLPDTTPKSRPNRSRHLPVRFRNNADANSTNPHRPPFGGYAPLLGASFDAFATADIFDQMKSAEGKLASQNIVEEANNEHRKHPYADLNESSYCVRCTGYDAKEDTFEPIHQVPREAVVAYCNRKSLPLPQDLYKAHAV